MSAIIIDGKKIAKQLREEIAKKVKDTKQKPGLAVVMLGSDPGSEIYVNSKKKMSKEVGFHSEIHLLKEDTSLGDLLQLIMDLNNNPMIHGILVQLPLPNNMDGKLVMDSILPTKDVDGFHPLNVGELFVGNKSIVPCTPRGIMKLIESTNVPLEGKNAVIVGRSNIVGKPMAHLLLEKNTTVTICHSKTKNLEQFTKNADVLVAAVGVPEIIKGNMIKPGAIVIDVGINRIAGKVVGDVEFLSASEVAGFITPVPGGVGPMTIACLLENTLDCMELYSKR